MFGRHPRLPVDLVFGFSAISQPCEYSEYVQTLHDFLMRAYALANQTSQHAKEQQKRYYDQKAKSQDFRIGDRVLVRACHVEGTQKLRDRWDPRPYVVVKKQPNVPVYVVRPEEGGPERVIHRNLLTQCMFLPVERETRGCMEEGQSDDELCDGMEEMEDGVTTGKVNGEEHPSGEQTNTGAEESGVPTFTPRRHPRRSRRPPARLSYETRSMEVESDQQKIERGRKLWQEAKARRAAGHI